MQTYLKLAFHLKIKIFHLPPLCITNYNLHTNALILVKVESKREIMHYKVNLATNPKKRCKSCLIIFHKKKTDSFRIFDVLKTTSIYPHCLTLPITYLLAQHQVLITQFIFIVLEAIYIPN